MRDRGLEVGTADRKVEHFPGKGEVYSEGLKGSRDSTPLARSALKSGGVLAVWSHGPDIGFTRRLKQAGFGVEEVSTRANGKRGARHIIWIATKT